MTLNDIERRNGRYFTLCRRIRLLSGLKVLVVLNGDNVIIIIIIERKDLGGVMSKRLQGHLITLKTVPKRECDAK